MKGKSPGENMCTLDNRTRAHLLPYSYFKNSTSLCSLLLVLYFLVSVWCRSVRSADKAENDLLFVVVAFF